ncbi:MAG: thermostable hemolysin [Gammaproteobacteria bacterium]|nr:thermostable hemolysin [Gammaproteobacteria bacterium]
MLALSSYTVSTNLATRTEELPRLEEIGRDHPRRAEAEAFVAASFLAQYGACLHHFLPTLLAQRDERGELVGVAGCATAAGHALFLEQYLDTPVEEAIAARTGLHLPRSAIVEVGNLATTSPGGARLLIRAVTAHLHGQGHRWVVFTATRMLQNAFRRLGLQPQVLAPADPARLGSDAKDWGTYYAQAPQVVCGPIALGYHCLHDGVAEQAHSGPLPAAGEGGVQRRERGA